MSGGGREMRAGGDREAKNMGQVGKDGGGRRNERQGRVGRLPSIVITAKTVFVRPRTLTIYSLSSPVLIIS